VTAGGARFLRDNVFLIAAVSLPIVVVGFFLLATAVPRWFVPPPSYGLVLQAGGPYAQTPRRVAIDFDVRNGRLEATLRLMPREQVASPTTLFLFEPDTASLREIPVEPPADLPEDGTPRTIAVEALAGRTLLAQETAPDGYELRTGSGRGPGLVGELFGMNRYEPRVSLVNRGRVVPVTLPGGTRYFLPVRAVAWVAPEGRR
jgi:hypothetical protein